MPLLFGVFGIKNGTINLVASLLILFVLVLWMALIYWTYADARRRISDPMLVGCATAASLFPFVGTIVYMIVRPPEYLEDVRERELEMQAAEARLAEVGFHLCPHCEAEVEKDFLRCPSCMRKLKDPCANCGRPLDPGWKICPYCEAQVGQASTQRRVRRRREGMPEQAPGQPAPSAGAAPAASPGVPAPAGAGGPPSSTGAQVPGSGTQPVGAPAGESRRAAAETRRPGAETRRPGADTRRPAAG